MKGLNDEQKKQLFARAEKAKEDGTPLSELFKNFAIENGRASGSIRNYYYRSVADGLAGNLTAKSNEYFTESAEKQLIARFLRERKVHGSIRKTAFYLADGDPVLALRYRNKFCNLLKKKREAVLDEIKSIKLSGEECYDPYEARKGCVRYEKARLKNEIDVLVRKIAQKCRGENSELKRKIEELDALNAKSPIIGYADKDKKPAISKLKHSGKNKRAENQ